ncbi:amino acid permease [candidate division KSB1 bacterium]|nr:amino acid permease [candidate division KSB1 bacterium]NIV69433.1 amino acid permease [Phycisphaerae bacterium]NIR70731.1 amino acid permease [candidate division KSB1 bacterium]NIS27788.1 amino acid permease [candidate division KSB1 bacterium]NIT74636.1 amino acid permease [candidate division KSB1 bacterium]
MKDNPGLPRKLGPGDGIGLVISNVIGVGIFTTPGIVAGLVPNPVAILALWLAGGVLALVGAIAYAELAALVPRAGGEYIYISRAYGPVVGFLAGWTSFVAGFSGAIAASAVGFAIYLERFISVLGDTKPIATLQIAMLSLELSPRRLLAVAIVFLISAIHVRGIKLGKLVQNWLVVLGLLAIGVLLVAGLLSGESNSHISSPDRDQFTLSAWLLALIPIMFTYSGWNAAVYLSEEMKEPAKNVLIALTFGTFVVIVIYLMLNLFYLKTLSVAVLAETLNAGDATAEVLLGSNGAAVITITILLALMSSVSAMVMAGSRTVCAMARDGVFPRGAGKVHLGYKTPCVAITTQGVWSCILILSGTFEDLLLYTGFAITLFSAVAVLSLFVLRRRCANTTYMNRPFGGLIGPASFSLCGLILVVNAIWANPHAAASGLLIIAIGLPAYFGCQVWQKITDRNLNFWGRAQ